jgi:ribosome assembly protein SQT1
MKTAQEIAEDVSDEEGDVFIDSEDVLAEVPDDGDHLMDEDDEAEDGVGDLPPEDSDVKDNSLQHFTTHSGSVFAISCHPTEPLAVSGGEDDLGYIWDITDGEVIVKLTGHVDSVCSASFSSDGQMVATGGMDGKVRIWRRVGTVDFRNWEFLTELQGPDEVIVSVSINPFDHIHILTIIQIQWLRWHPRGTILLAGSNDSMVWLWQCMSTI